MKGPKVGVIVQARMGSTRLPGKVLKKLYKNDRVLDVLIKRLKLSKRLNEIIIATTTDIKDKVIIEVASEHNVSSFVGDEENVLLRYYEASKKYNLDIIIRVTSDCPFIDPKVLDEMIEFYKNQNYDYIRNVDETTNFSRGFEIEIFNIIGKNGKFFRMCINIISNVFFFTFQPGIFEYFFQYIEIKNLYLKTS